MEIGPYRLKDENTLVYNDGAWNEFANVMFVDNPVGTGYSYADTDSFVHSLDEMADQFIAFLEKWFKLFPEYEHDDVGLALPLFYVCAHAAVADPLQNSSTLPASPSPANTSPTSHTTSSSATRDRT